MARNPTTWAWASRWAVGVRNPSSDMELEMLMETVKAPVAQKANLDDT